LQGVEVVQPIADAAKIHLDWTPLSVWVWAAPDAIVQTLMNLASNAIKFFTIKTFITGFLAVSVAVTKYSRKNPVSDYP
jgi:Signal transduction histidine kinase